jgi:hypothetical protein
MRSPQENGGVLCQPALNEIPPLVKANVERLRNRSETTSLLAERREPSGASPEGLLPAAKIGNNADISERILSGAANVRILDHALPDFRSRARAYLLSAAAEYSSGLVSPRSELNPDAPLIVSGHQPELFHPGVWSKNFALAVAAKSVQGNGINLIIDNDVLGKPAITVPAGTLDQPRTESVLIDRGAGGMPWEERAVQDPEFLSGFAQRVREKILPFETGEPLLYERWKPENLDTALPLGECLSHWRRGVEAEFGVCNLELPLSHVCDSEWFLRFLLHILDRAESFQQIYNARLAEYRHVHKLRSQSHPVPNLNSNNGAIELPFWVWQKQEKDVAAVAIHRQGLFVRDRGERTELLSGSEGPIIGTIPKLQNADSIAHAVAELQQGINRGARIRPRALTTTMFLRLCAADFFLHGIGGAKYDQLTDAILADFFNVLPPAFATVTATFTLPLSIPSVSHVDVRQTQAKLRELEYHPEQLLSPLQAAEWKEQKAAWIGAVADDDRRTQFEKIEEANAQMGKLLAEVVATTQAHLELQQQQLRVKEKLSSREFSFCLFPSTLGNALKSRFT